MKESEIRNEIAHSIKSVRLSCWGRRCLRECLRRMAAAAPHPRASRRRWGAAVAAFFMSLGAYAQVFCSWVEEPGIPAHYECTGQGQYITVNAADQVVVTNMFGGCTNCINVTPATCRDLRQQVRALYDDMENTATALTNGISFVLTDISSQLDDIDGFRTFSDSPSLDRVGYTNYLSSSESNWQHDYMRNNFQNYDSVYGPVLQGQIRTCNGIYDYANENVRPSLRRWKNDLSTLSSYANDVLGLGKVMRDQVLDNLNCDACSDSSSGGSCDCNESTGGKWCTEEQGDAIIDLLEDTKDYVEKLQISVVSISNSVEVAIQNLHDGFFTSYTNIPTEEELGSRWQDLYLEGYSPNFHEYAKTNILARIELLLAGMSGVLTNNADYADAGEFADTGLAVTNELENALYGLTNGVADQIQLREEKIRSVGDSLIGLYNAFRGWSGTPFSRQTLINSYSVEIGQDHWDVPSFEPSANGLAVANMIRLVCRSVMSVFYILFTVVVFVRFHIAFFQWVLKYLKWAIELMQGLFI